MTTTALDVLSLEVAKQQLRILGTTDDAIITTNINAAVSYVETVTGRTITGSGAETPTQGMIHLIILVTREFFEGLRKPSAAVEAMLSRYRLQFADTDDTTGTITESDVNVKYQIADLAITVPLSSLTAGFVKEIDAPTGALNGDGSVDGELILYIDSTRAGTISLVAVDDAADFRLAIVADIGGVLLATLASEIESSAVENSDGSISVTLDAATVIATFDDPPPP